MGTDYALAVNSGTSALVCALIAVGVGGPGGDEVIIPAYTWVATAAAVVLVNAIPVLAEIDSSLTLDPLDVERKITARTKALLVVHMRGISADLRPLLAIAENTICR